MNYPFLFLLLVILVGGYLLMKKIDRLMEKDKEESAVTEWLKSMQKSLDETNRNISQAMRETNRTVVESLQRSSQNMNQRLDKTAEFIAGVKEEVGKMAEIGRGMKDIQEFLRSPKLRGNIGEMVLKQILAQSLPKSSFHLQYKFKSGETVDAAIRTNAGIIPVDSKFPMENFRRLTAAREKNEKEAARRAFINDVRKHIRAIASKYILPEEGTIDYALMYIPSEAVYYEVVNDPDLFEYAGKHQVLPVSPTTFYAYMRAILMSFEGQKIEARAKRILASLRAMEGDYQKVSENLSVLNRHLTNAYNQMNNVTLNFNLLGQKLANTKILEGKEEKLLKDE